MAATSLQQISCPPLQGHKVGGANLPLRKPSWRGGGCGVGFGPLPPLAPFGLRSGTRRQRLRVVAEATSGKENPFEEIAAVLSKAARSVSSGAAKVLEEADLRGRLERALLAANHRLEEFTFDARRQAQKWNNKYGVLRRVRQAADFAGQQARNVDRQFQIGQKLRGASLDLQRNWPTYRRRVDSFLQTPLGKTFSTLVFLWLLLSGWLFRILILSMWILPFAAPILISAAARNTVIEGACPSCKRRFIGNRNQMIVCNYCRAVVWQPRRDFSRDDSDPQIIDIDVDHNK